MGFAVWEMRRRRSRRGACRLSTCAAEPSPILTLPPHSRTKHPQTVVLSIHTRRNKRALANPHSVRALHMAAALTNPTHLTRIRPPLHTPLPFLVIPITAKRPYRMPSFTLVPMLPPAAPRMWWTTSCWSPSSHRPSGSRWVGSARRGRPCGRGRALMVRPKISQYLPPASPPDA